MRTAKKILTGTLCAGLCALLCGCELLLVPDDYVSSYASGGDRHQAVNKAAPAEGIGDADSLYTAYDSTEPVCFYVTVTGGNAADGTDHTLEEVNSYLNLQGMTGVEKIRTEIILQVGDEEGPREGELGFGAVSGNAAMNVRGRTSTGYGQKSYRISLYDGAGLWRGQKAIALNKHPADVTRIRNMLYFKLLKDVPSIPSLRTQFVHLWVRDLTAENPVDEFVDYGLFTQVELPNNRYLRNHGLSVNGNLYKANMCEMYRYPDNLKLATDPDYDPVRFGEVLESKTGDDHTKLLRMLDAVNDYSIPAEELLGKYFDEDNLTSYLAFNLLMGNPDSNAQNYLLYSPIDSERWYYLCWDGDGCLKYSEYDILGDAFEEGEWTRGVSDYWGVVLFNRLLRLPSFREALSAKVEALRSVVTAERVEELVSEYRKTADLYAAASPDSAGMKVTAADRDKILKSLPGDVELSYRYYLESLDKPMPFYQGDAEADGDRLQLRWGASFDFDGEFLRYDVTVAKDWTFSDPVYEAKGILETETSLPMPEAGESWWRVTVTNESGHSQTSFDSVITSTGAHQGMRRFTIQSDGTVVNPE